MKDKITDTLYCIAMPLIVAVMVVGLSVACPAEAEAAQLKAAKMSTDPVACSLPFVDDVNEWGKGKVILTVYCCGSAKSYQMKATDCKTGKKAKAVRSPKHRNVWTVVVKKGHVYKLSVRPKGGKWRSIYYGVC